MIAASLVYYLRANGLTIRRTAGFRSVVATNDSARKPGRDRSRLHVETARQHRPNPIRLPSLPLKTQSLIR
jgi:hypothetical protein